MRTTDLSFTLTLALTAISNSDAERSAEAILRACEIAHFLDDGEALRSATSALNDLAGDPTRLAQVSLRTRTELQLTGIYINAMRNGDLAGSLRQLDALEEADAAAGAASEWRTAGRNLAPIIRAHRARILAISGKLQASFDASGGAGGATAQDADALTLPAQIFETFVLTQRGAFRQALEKGSLVRQLSQLHETRAAASGGLEIFAVFIVHWARGTSHASKRLLVTLETGRPDLTASWSHSSIINLAVSLSAVQDGRWSEAAAFAERTVSGLERNDPFGAMALAQTVLALSKAVLGDAHAAQLALDRAGFGRLGLSRALHGFVRLLALRTRQWLRDPSVATRALELASWSSAEGLALVELEALDIAAHAQPRPDPNLLERARAVVGQVDSPVGEALMMHLQSRYTDGAGIEPEERLLSELGVWWPLPPTTGLTGREREIALFTSLGYPAKHVAARLHLSVRTVEAHLTNVYTKLGLNGREALREWFATQREGDV